MDGKPITHLLHPSVDLLVQWVQPLESDAHICIPFCVGIFAAFGYFLWSGLGS
jgi:hypothetical protein